MKVKQEKRRRLVAVTEMTAVREALLRVVEVVRRWVEEVLAPAMRQLHAAMQASMPWRGVR